MFKRGLDNQLTIHSATQGFALCKNKMKKTRVRFVFGQYYS